MKNIDIKTVEGFGEEWSLFDQSGLTDKEKQKIFDDYFDIFPWGLLPNAPCGADIGCGSGRWASVVAPMVDKLHLIDASDQALGVAKANLKAITNCEYTHASVSELPFENESLDFAYSLGVLHHVPDTASAIMSISKKLKPGAPLLLYLYYAFDNRPWWYKTIWTFSEVSRKIISKMPFLLRKIVCQIIAVLIYWPLARSAWLLEFLKLRPCSWPLSYYRDKTFYVMQTDALDRFGTQLEQRFSKRDIEDMLQQARFKDITFSNHPPYWCVVGIKG